MHQSARLYTSKAGFTASAIQPRWSVICRVEDSQSKGKQKSQQKGQQKGQLPLKGYFSIADTSQEVYFKPGERFDPKKKPGRYKPEFIWNTNWQTALEREQQLDKQREEALAREQPKESGFLSLSRLAELDSLDIDLTDALVRAKPQQTEGSATGKASKPTIQMPTGRERDKYARQGRYAVRAATIAELSKMDQEDQVAVREAERKQYDQMKLDFQVWTVVLAVVAFSMTAVLYTGEVAVSYAIGAAGGLLYLRLLSRTVDSFGTGGLGGVLGQPRLLIPAVLILGCNRWNVLYADDYGFAFSFLPALAGFFTYKVAVFARQSLDIMNDISDSIKRESAEREDRG